MNKDYITLDVLDDTGLGNNANVKLPDQTLL